MGMAIPANTGYAAGPSIHMLQKITHDERVLAKHKMLILKCQGRRGERPGRRVLPRTRVTRQPRPSASRRYTSGSSEASTTMASPSDPTT
jgi:hypothetical protein